MSGSVGIERQPQPATQITLAPLEEKAEMPVVTRSMTRRAAAQRSTEAQRNRERAALLAILSGLKSTDPSTLRKWRTDEDEETGIWRTEDTGAAAAATAPAKDWRDEDSDEEDEEDFDLQEWDRLREEEMDRDHEWQEEITAAQEDIQRRVRERSAAVASEIEAAAALTPSVDTRVPPPIRTPPRTPTPAPASVSPAAALPPPAPVKRPVSERRRKELQEKCSWDWFVQSAAETGDGLLDDEFDAYCFLAKERWRHYERTGEERPLQDFDAAHPEPRAGEVATRGEVLALRAEVRNLRRVVAGLIAWQQEQKTEDIQGHIDDLRREFEREQEKFAAAMDKEDEEDEA